MVGTLNFVSTEIIEPTRKMPTHKVNAHSNVIVILKSPSFREQNHIAGHLRVQAFVRV